MERLLPLIIICFSLQAEIPAPLKSFTDKFCLDCHDTEMQEGELNIENLSFKLTDLVKNLCFGQYLIFNLLRKKNQKDDQNHQGSGKELVLIKNAFLRIKRVRAAAPIRELPIPDNLKAFFSAS